MQTIAINDPHSAAGLSGKGSCHVYGCSGPGLTDHKLIPVEHPGMPVWLATEAQQVPESLIHTRPNVINMLWITRIAVSKMKAQLG